MLDGILPASFSAGAVASQAFEPKPAAWPGPYCPNFSDWDVGDIVLVHGADDWTGLAIHVAQFISRNVYSVVGRRVSHAGIYLGDGMMIDAVFGGVIGQKSVWHYCQYCRLALRRIPGLQAAERTNIAQAASAHLGESYSTLELLRSKLWPGTRPRSDRLYCSTFVGLVMADALGVLLDGLPGCRPLYPATIAAHPGLDVVPLEWRN